MIIHRHLGIHRPTFGPHRRAAAVGDPGAVTAAGALITSLADLVLPACCAGCGRPGAVLCRRCRPCGVPLSVTAPAVPGLPVLAAGSYSHALRAALLAYKERGRRELARPLAAVLSGAVAAAQDAATVAVLAPVLVPVPSTRAAARARGGDHVLRLARIAAQSSGGPVLPALRLRRMTRDSAHLNVAERLVNIGGAMSAAPPPPGGPTRALIVDDIITSGATIAEATRALGEAGWSVLGAAVVAATPRTGRARRA